MIDLKAFRKANRLTQADVADFLSVSAPFITKIEKGDNKLPEDKLQKLLQNELGWDTSMLEKPREVERKKIPLYDDAITVGGINGMQADVDFQARVTEWIDAGDWFPNATSAMHHYGDSMTEYPSGCILALRRVHDFKLIINGENYVIETDEFRITKQIQDDGGDFIMAYSSNRDTYPDGRLIHSPIKIPKESIRHLDLVLGCVIKRFSNGPVKIIR